MQAKREFDSNSQTKAQSPNQSPVPPTITYTDYKRGDTARISSQKETYRYRLRLGWAETRGRRPNMEDTISIFTNFRGNPYRVLLCSFDGHTGEKSAELAARRICPVLNSKIDEIESRKMDEHRKLHSSAKVEIDEDTPRDKFEEVHHRKPNVMDSPSLEDISLNDKITNSNEKLFKSSDNIKGINWKALTNPKSYKDSPKLEKEKRDKTRSKKQEKLSLSKTLKNAVNKTQIAIHNEIKFSENDYIYIFESVFTDIHQEIYKKQLHDGTTAIVALLELDNHRMIIANTGDQRAVLARGDKSIQITVDHKPQEPAENMRIYNVGGYVNDQNRVNGILAVSRSLGDADLSPAVTHLPDVFEVELKPDDRFIIIACDGLWDVMSNEKAVSIVDLYRCPVQAAVALRDYAFGLGSSDNISVIVYRLDDIISMTDLNLHSSALSNGNSPSNSGDQSKLNVVLYSDEDSNNITPNDSTDSLKTYARKLKTPKKSKSNKTKSRNTKSPMKLSPGGSLTEPPSPRLILSSDKERERDRERPTKKHTLHSTDSSES